ncbi:unnamed protein product [Rhizoctonia solani]|uniref:Uncharacterized protein n=1 Tax=Rhizoctonia solani TaxID=456999 RepID=A0A8H2WDK9_9AGAM|nr:unnamed protein product [Rhizoctonia solani]
MKTHSDEDNEDNSNDGHIKPASLPPEYNDNEPPSSDKDECDNVQQEPKPEPRQWQPARRPKPKFLQIEAEGEKDAAEDDQGTSRVDGESDQRATEVPKASSSKPGCEPITSADDLLANGKARVVGRIKIKVAPPTEHQLRSRRKD